MSVGDYRLKAAYLKTKAEAETNEAIRAELESLVRGYLRLADQAERNAVADLTYETPAYDEAPSKLP